MHSSGDLTEITLVALAALLGGLGFTRLKQPAVLGYVIAGVILGPSGFSLIESREQIGYMAELGVLLLLFILGLELNLRTFREIWRVALGCVFLQITSALAMMFLASLVFQFSFATTLLIGFMTALSSTAVSVAMLENMGELKTTAGRLTIGILIAQDLAFVPMTLIIKSFGGTSFSIFTLIKLCFAIGLLFAIIIFLSRHERVKIPFLHLISQKKELFPLLGLSFCFLAAALSGLLEVSAAYGAFVAGLILGNTSERQAIIKATHPTQSILLMTFFLSVGLLLDLEFMIQNWFKVFTLLLMIFMVKTILNAFFLKYFGQPLEIALLSSLVLAQIGEFSFVLASIGSQVKILDQAGRDLVICLTVLSLLLSPIWMLGAQRLRRIHSSVRKKDSLKGFFTTIYMPEIRFFSQTIECLQPLFKKISDFFKKK
jgi:CPA2 family monovalent cation:H+ antiporter-2